jgi:acyl-CoA dehydrogenase family protein 9
MRDRPYEKILRDIRIFPIFEGANDVMRLFIALEGLEALGEELDDLRHIDLHHPLQTLGAVSGYLGKRVQRRLAPDQLDRAHPTFDDQARAAAELVPALRNAGEALLRRHGTDVIDQQAQLKRLAHAAIEIYAQIATISRASSALAYHATATTGDTELSDETFIAQTFCRRAEHRTHRWLRQLDDNDDDATRRIAEAVIAHGSYPHAP